MSAAKYTPSQTAALREAMLRDHVEPLIQSMFDRHTRLQSAMLLVAQYWNDEAEDAVHYELIYSERETPDVEAATDLDRQDDVNFAIPPSEATWDELRDAFIDGWHENTDAIPLFAAFTREAGDQERDVTENYEPYALFRRTPQGLTTEVVGKMLRPWLDGVRPTWERSP